jgi:DNA-binding CsgD family transcriptional regulator
LKQALDQEGVISLTIEGQVQVMTPQAEQLLGQYFGCLESHILPDSLQRWFKQQMARLPFDGDVSFAASLQIEQSGQQLRIWLIPDPFREHYLLLLEEEKLPSFSIASLEMLGLTKREAEVLFWVARDKSNTSIAKVLDCCEGTVRKHLEHLYKKLGVQTRMGAVMVALEKLGLLKG